MKYLPIYFLLIITITQLFGCGKSNKSAIEIDSKSYIKDFELIQENPNNQTSIKILSPNAIIDTIKNDIDDLKKLPCKSQDNTESFPYLWMHKEIRKKTLRKLFL